MFRFVIHAGHVVERRVRQGDIGAPVADMVGAVGGSAEEDVHLAGVGPAGAGGGPKCSSSATATKYSSSRVSSPAMPQD
ncbi:hypothetical protein [Streptomyces parvulus]|uniref:hypothetical protein n=1 Tax=Streptomyces parvulus TaxID=146923 RepID=UPI0036992A18